MRGSGYKIQCFNFKIQCSADQREDRTLASVSRENYIGDFEPDRIFGSAVSIYLKILSCAQNQQYSSQFTVVCEN